MRAFRTTIESLQRASPIRRVAGLSALMVILALPMGLLLNVQLLLNGLPAGQPADIEAFLGVLLINVPAGCLLTTLGFWLVQRLTAESQRFALMAYAILTTSYAMLVVHTRELALKSLQSPGTRFGLLAAMVVMGLMCLKLARSRTASPLR